MPRVDPALTRLRKICRSLPDSEETPTWGQPHFRVCNKIFAGFGDHKGQTLITFKLPMALADMVVEEPYFSRAPYGGKHGWVSLDVKGARNWRRIESMIRESYRLIAPRRTLAKLESGPAGGKPARKKNASKKKATKRPAKPSKSPKAKTKKKAASKARR